MNCIIHNDTPAVGNCGQCGCGICKECVQNSIRAEGIDKPICNNCAIEGVSIWVENARARLKGLKTKKIIWTIILVIGAFCIISGLVNLAQGVDGANVALPIIVGILVWAGAGFTERFTEKSVEQQITDGMVARDALRGDNYVWFVYLGRLIAWFIKNMFRGLIFPIIYARFMISGSKELQNQINEQQAVIDDLKAQSA